MSQRNVALLVGRIRKLVEINYLLYKVGPIIIMLILQMREFRQRK